MVTTTTRRRTRSPPHRRAARCNSSWSPLDDDYLADPYPIAARLRDEHPVFYAEQTRLRRRDPDGGHRARLHPSRRVRLEQRAGPRVPVVGRGRVDPVGRRFRPGRRDVEPARSPTTAESGSTRGRASGIGDSRSLEDYMRSRATSLIDAMIAGGSPAEYVSALAFPLPAEIMFRFIGFPPEDDAMVKAWCVNRRAFSWGRPTADEQAEIAVGMLDYWRYCRDFVARRDAERADDFTSELLDAHDADPDPTNGTGISYREVESVVYGHQLRRPRPGHRSAVQHPDLPVAPSRPMGCVGRTTRRWSPTPSKRHCVMNRARSRGDGSRPGRPRSAESTCPRAPACS